MLLDPSPRREAWLTKGCSDLRLVRHPRQARTDAHQPAQGPLFHHDVHKLARHDNGLHDGFARHKFFYSVIIKGKFFECGLVHVLRDRCLRADLAVHLEHDFHGVFYGLGVVGFRPGDVRERFVVSEDAPHFFGDMRGERVQQLHEGFARFAVALVHLHHFVVEDHQLANRGIEAHVLNVARDLDDALVHDFGEFCGNRRVFVFNGVFFTDDRTECAGKETVHAFDSLGIPRLDRIEGTHENFVQAKRIRAVFLNDIVRVHHVFQGLAHFGDNLMQLFSRFFIKEFSAFFFDLIDGDFGACVVFVSVGENHALVEEFLERFVGRDAAEIEQHVDTFGVRGYGSAIKIR